MDYYKNTDGEVYAYDEGQTPLEGLTKLTAAQVTEHINPTQAELDEAFANELKVYRDEKSETYEYKGVPLNLNDGARSDLSALYFQTLLVPTITDETVMANWSEKGYDVIQITAGDLRADGVDIFAHRQKCFTAFAAVNPADFDDIDVMKAAFDEAYASI